MAESPSTAVSETQPKRIGTGLAGPGRPKGVVPQLTREVRAAARALIEDPDYVETLKIRLRVGEAPHMETLLWHYAYGKPVDRVEVKDTTDSGDDLSTDELRARALAVAATIVHIQPKDESREATH